MAQNIINRNPLPSRRLMDPFVRVRIGDDMFVLGDGRLKSCEVTLAEGETSSSCEFSIYDAGRFFANKYFLVVYEQDGLTPAVLPGREKGKDKNGTPTSSGVANDTFSAEVMAFLDVLAEKESNGRYNVINGGSTFDNGYADHPRRFTGISDAAGRYQFLSTTWDEVAGRLGLDNFSPENQDRAAVEYIRARGALDEIEAGNFEEACAILRPAWTSLPGAAESQWSMEEARAFYEQRLAYYGDQPANKSKEEAQASVVEAGQKPQVETPEQPTSFAGQQITVEMGYAGETIAAYSYLHTSLDYDLFNPDLLTFGGQAATWVLGQRKKNTAYVNLTLKEIAAKICESYGLTLDIEGDGPKYEYFPQYGQSDYEALLIEARRIGWRMWCQGKVLHLKPRKANDSGFVLAYGENLGIGFQVRHQAQGDSAGGARASTPGERSTTGERKFVVDPDTGEMTQTRKENDVGTGKEGTVATTGSHIASLKPVIQTDDPQKDKNRENEMRVKGIVANFQMVTTPEALLLTPDDAFSTSGISPFLDRAWVIESITHSYDEGGFTTTGTCYTPLKNRFPSSNGEEGEGGSSLGADNANVPPLNPEGFINPTTGILTSGFRTASRPNHMGVDIADVEGTPIWASADGTVEDVQDGCVIGDRSCGGGYGNLVFIRHADGYQTRYAHMKNGSVTVKIGDQVKQGQVIGKQSDTGNSFGTHLHFEIRQGGAAINPAPLIGIK